MKKPLNQKQKTFLIVYFFAHLAFVLFGLFVLRAEIFTGVVSLVSLAVLATIVTNLRKEEP